MNEDSAATVRRINTGDMSEIEARRSSKKFAYVKLGYSAAPKTRIIKHSPNAEPALMLGDNCGAFAAEMECNMNVETDRKIESERKTDLSENLTLQEIFDRNKAGALENALKLAERIRHIDLDGWFDDVVEADDNRPMPARRLAQQLCKQLRNLEYLIIISNENSQ
jgi:hypothetical protein